MNTPDNKRRRESQEKIMKAFVRQLQNKELAQISVTEICHEAGINRSTFYANYLDIYDLADQFAESLIDSFFKMYAEEIEYHFHSYNFAKLLQNIKENPLVYEAFMKLDVEISDLLGDKFNYAIPKDDALRKYSQEFAKAGMNAVIKRWILDGCAEPPSQIEKVLQKYIKAGDTMPDKW